MMKGAANIADQQANAEALPAISGVTKNEVASPPPPQLLLREVSKDCPALHKAESSSRAEVGCLARGRFPALLTEQPR